ncbi:MAG: hypothetical protein WC760_07170 [Bacteroidia bacterium]|jgi:hypothetical protein
MSFTGNENHSISLEDAAALTKNYRDANINPIIGEYFGQTAIEEILAQTGCVGIRAYFAICDPTSLEPKLRLVICGVDSSENDILNIIAENGSLCPPNCSTANALNSDE